MSQNIQLNCLKNLKKKITNQTDPNLATYAYPATGPVSVEGYYHNITAKGLFTCYFPNYTDKINPIKVVVESYMCIENDNCFYNKTNYDLKYGQAVACRSELFVTQEMRERGIFEDEAIVTIKSDHNDDLYSKAVNGVYIY